MSEAEPQGKPFGLAQPSRLSAGFHDLRQDFSPLYCREVVISV
ncbi:MAG: hypothetical protein AB1453_01825 [Chloroflexota bacterium]